MLKTNKRGINLQYLEKTRKVFINFQHFTPHLLEKTQGDRYQRMNKSLTSSCPKYDRDWKKGSVNKKKTSNISFQNKWLRANADIILHITWTMTQNLDK